MKKILAVTVAALLLLALAACGAEKTEQKPAEPDVNVGMANPWSEVKDAAAAAEGAGVGYFEVPEEGAETSGGEVHWSAFRCMKGIAQADGCIGSAELTVRKGLKQDGEDVSGDYTEYKYKWTQELDSVTLNCFGNEKGRTMKAIWVTDNFSYCILVRGQGDIYDTYGIDADATAALASQIQ